MSQPPEHARYEVKFVAEATRYQQLRNWVRLHPAGFRNAFPPRRVNNIYFDTPGLITYVENVAGVSDRSKIRLRWYGENTRPERSRLEVKRRRNTLGWKFAWPTPGLDLTKRRWNSLRRELRDALPPAGRLWLDNHPIPVLMNRYDREYFVSPDQKVRVTLDAHQAVYDQRQGLLPNLRRGTNLPDTLVLEVKFARPDRQLGSQVMRSIPIRVSRNSKYVIGVRSILGG